MVLCNLDYSTVFGFSLSHVPKRFSGRTTAVLAGLRILETQRGCVVFQVLSGSLTKGGLVGLIVP